MIIEFKGRKEIIKRIQEELKLTPADGLDGVNTWRAIVDRIIPKGSSVPIPPSKSLNFSSRYYVVSMVQHRLGITEDGSDGQETWSAISEFILPVSILKIPSSVHHTEKILQTPNFSIALNKRKGVVFHHAAGYYDGTISWCMNKASKVSYHCLINLDGQRTILAKDEHRTWHAGESSFKGVPHCNSYMLGVAYIGNTNTGAMRSGLKELTEGELSSTVEWLKPRAKLYGWTIDDMTHHRVVSPGRKDDLSLACWEQLTEILRTIL